MGVYAVTGSASGMGRAVVEKLRTAGHTVIGVDIQQAEVSADLSTAQGRRAAIDGVLAAAAGRLDGVVLAAGVGPIPGPGQAKLIIEVNYFGVVDLLVGLRPALARTGRAKAVVFSSNSTTTVPAVPMRAVRALLAGNGEKAVRAVKLFGRNAPTFAYAASKIAATHWVRRAAVTADWAGAGIRLNAIAPGAIRTPLLESQLAVPAQAKLIDSFPVPIGGFGEPTQVADWAVLMLSDSADFLCGSVVFVDGGSDAYFRPDDWPRPLPAHRVLGYLRRMRAFRLTR